MVWTRNGYEKATMGPRESTFEPQISSEDSILPATPLDIVRASVVPPTFEIAASTLTTPTVCTVTEQGAPAIGTQGSEVLTPGPQHKPRGRPKGSRNKRPLKGSKVAIGTEANGEDVGLIQNQLILLPVEHQESDGAMTRARRALLMGQRMGMSCDCSEESALKSIAAQIQARRS